MKIPTDKRIEEYPFARPKTALSQRVLIEDRPLSRKSLGISKYKRPKSADVRFFNANTHGKRSLYQQLLPPTVNCPMIPPMIIQSIRRYKIEITKVEDRESGKRPEVLTLPKIKTPGTRPTLDKSSNIGDKVGSKF